MSAKPRVRVKAPMVYVRPGERLGVVVPIMPRSDDKVWECLGNMQEVAERGELSGIAIAATHHDGSVSTCFAIGNNIYTLVGAIRQIGRRVENDIPTG